MRRAAALLIGLGLALPVAAQTLPDSWFAAATAPAKSGGPDLDRANARGE